MKPPFADSLYYLALLSADDQWHDRAVKLTPGLHETITTAWILTEFADALCRRETRASAATFIADLRSDSHVIIIPPSMVLFEEAFELYMKRPDKDWSLTDCVSFVVMRQEGLTDALAADHHFEQAGFNVLMKPAR